MIDSRHTLRERGASMIEAAVSAALVGMVVITAVNSLGGGLRDTVNTIARALNPSSPSGPTGLSIGTSQEGSGLSGITSNMQGGSRPAAVEQDPGTTRPSIRPGGLGFSR